MKLPRVSICLLTYKRAHALPKTIDSLLRQTHADFELIINDDCSPDDTESVCRAYAQRDSRVRYCKNSKNLRYTGNQNAAILRASTDYVGIVHDGDLYREDMVERWTRALVDHPSAAIAFNAIENLDDQGNVARAHYHPYGPLTNGRELLVDMLRRWYSPIFGITMVRRRAVLDAGPFDPRFPVLADIDMWMRLLLRHDAAYIPEPLFATYPREAGHINTYQNEKVLAEQELIFALNHRRLSLVGGMDLTTTARISAMIWRVRVHRMLMSVRDRNVGALGRLVKHAQATPLPLKLSDDTPDTATDWESFARHAMPDDSALVAAP